MTRRLPILTFHAIEDDPSPIAFPPPLFRDVLRAIDRHSYPTLSLRDAVAGLARRETLPERAVVLTFDDGYRSVYDEAFPLLRALRMTATIFLSAGGPAAGPEQRLPPYAGRERMSWEEVREMSAAGIEFGAHT
ncbi:MAG: polysaccharide deacetylase family protein, partial [Candidatus Eisenbacteria bacterium]